MLAVVVAALGAVAESSAKPPSAAGCLQGKTLIHGAPSQSLLSILGVLRRPATPAGRLPSAFERNLLRPGFGSGEVDLFVHYVRRARVIAGTSYYIYAVRVAGCERQKSYEGVGDLATHVDLGHGIYGNDGGSGGATAAQIEQGLGALVTGPPSSSTSCTITMVVPDGVAGVTLHFPAGPANGFHKNIISPAATITTSAVGNFVVVSVPRSGGTIGRATMTWRATDGQTIKTFNRL